MPIPLIIMNIAARAAVTGAVAGAAALADAIDRRRHRRTAGPPVPPAKAVDDTLRLCVLGQSEVGKTTLINAWRGLGVDHVTTRTSVTETHTEVAVAAGHRRAVVSKLYDVSGLDIAWSQWGRVAGLSSHVLYLINAVGLYDEERRQPGQPPTASWDRIIDDAGQIRMWLEGRPTDLCILVVTHRDVDPRLPMLGWDGYHRHISNQLSAVMHKMGGEGRVRIVTGSLDTDAAAEALTGKILAYLS